MTAFTDYCPGVRLPLLSARPAVTFPAAEHLRHLAGTYFTVSRRVEGWVDLGALCRPTLVKYARLCVPLCIRDIERRTSDKFVINVVRRQFAVYPCLIWQAIENTSSGQNIVIRTGRELMTADSGPKSLGDENRHSFPSVKCFDISMALDTQVNRSYHNEIRHT